MKTTSELLDAPEVASFQDWCVRPGCANRVREAWEETGTLCARCALEIDLYDREARAAASFGVEVRRLHR
jgi:8-oxo-dGTP pyrophosphatase MutT (NUDIX family)